MFALVGLFAAQSVSGLDPTATDFPTYFPVPAGVTDRAGCGQHYDQAPQEAADGPIYTAPGEVSLCVWIPSFRQWYLHTGSQGNCRQACCEWFPPNSKNGTAAVKTPEPTIAWFATIDGTCNDEASAEVTPWIFTGAVSIFRTSADDVTLTPCSHIARW